MRVLLRCPAARLGAGLLLAAAGTSAGAQALDARAAAAVPRRALVRVRTAAGEVFYGTLVGRSADSLVVSAPEPVRRRAVALGAVDTLWVQRGTAAMPMGLTGAAVLGALGGLAAYGMSGGDSGPPCRGWCLVPYAGFGAGVGFALGGTVGAFVPLWRQHHPRDR